MVNIIHLKKYHMIEKKLKIHKPERNPHILTSTRDATRAGFGRTDVIVVPFPFFISEKKESNRYWKKKSIQLVRSCKTHKVAR